MTPEQKLKWAALLNDQKAKARYGDAPILPEITEENVDQLFEDANEDWEIQDSVSEIREGQFETEIPCQSSRHYESKSVAAQMPDGTWVGWTYWYGGGKHGEPESIDWMDEAYDLDVKVEEKVMTVRTFVKA